MKFRGKVHRFGDHVDTDVIIPAKYLGISDPAQLALRCFEPVAENFSAGVAQGDILVAGENFGCGSSREHAPIAIKAAGIACIVAASYARIFYRSAINIGLPVIVCPAAAVAAKQGDVVEVDVVKGVVDVGGTLFPVAPFPEAVLGIIESGGLVPFMQRRLASEAKGVRA